MFDMHLSPYEDFNNVSNNILILITLLVTRFFFGSINKFLPRKNAN